MQGKVWSVRTRLWLFAGVLLLNLGVVGVAFNIFLSKLNWHLNEISTRHLPTVRHMTLLDMVHDGLRAVVLRGIVEGATDKKAGEEVKEEFKEMSSKINEYLDAVANSHLGSGDKAEIDQAKKNIGEYVKGADELISIALSGNRPGAIEKLPHFEELFKILEKDLEKMGEEIEKGANVEVKLADEAAKTSKTVGIVLVAIGFIVGILASMFIISWMVRKFEEVLQGLSGGAEKINEVSTHIANSSVSLSDLPPINATTLDFPS